MAEQVSIELITDISKSLKTMEQFALAAKKKTEEASDSFSKFGKTALAAAAAAFSVNKIVGFLEDSVKAASEAEEANQKLASSLQLAGRFASDAVDSIDNFAKSIQAATVFEDDFVKSNIAVLVATTKLTEQGLKQATIAATNLAAGLKIDLGTAFDIVGKAANGNISTLNRNNIKVREGANAAETFSNALKAINSSFGGAAAGQADTYAGKVSQLKNNFGDLQEAIGNTIIKSKALNAVLGTTSDVVKALTKAVESPSTANLAFNELLAQKIYEVAKAAGLGEAKLRDLGQALRDNNIQLKRNEEDFDSLGLSITKAANGFGSLKLLDAKDLEAGKKAADEFINSQKKGVDLLAKGISEMSSQLPAEIKKIQDALKTAGKTEIETAKFIFDSQKKTIEQAGKYKLIKGSEANELLLSNEAQYHKKSLELAQKAAEERKKLTTDLASFSADALAKVDFGAFNSLKSATSQGGIDSAGNPINEQAKDINQDQQSQGAALALGGVQKALTGMQGVLDIFSGVLGAALGPLGSIAGGILSVLAKGPEAAAGFVTEFIKSIPLIISNIISAIPLIIESIISMLPDLITQLIELLVIKIPELIQKLAEMLPELINQLQIALIQKLPEIITNLVQGFVARLPEIVTGFTTEFAKQAPVLAVKFAVAFVKEVPNIVKALIDGIVDSIKSLGGLLGGGGEGGGGGIGGAISSFVSNPIGTIGDFLGFAEGGIVPPGFNKDNFPMRATSGELIIDRSQNKQLQEFLDNSAQGSGGGLTQVNIQVGEQQLASVMLNLSRGGYRTVA